MFYGAQADWLVSSEHFDAADKFPRMITKVRLSDSELEFQPTIGDPKVRENEGFPQVGDSEEKNWHFGVNLDERLREIYLTTEEKSEEETRRDFSLWRLELPLGKWTLRASFSLDNTVVEHSDVLRMFSYSASTGQLILLWDTADLQLKVVQRWFEPLKLDSLARLALQHL